MAWLARSTRALIVLTAAAACGAGRAPVLVTGRVVPRWEGPRPGILVTVLDSTPLRAWTDTSGFYRLRARLAPGCHQLRVGVMGSDIVVRFFQVRGEGGTIDLGEVTLMETPVEPRLTLYADCSLPDAGLEGSWGVDTIRAP
jgi:hypothetical protein